MIAVVLTEVVLPSVAIFLRLVMVVIVLALVVTKTESCHWSRQLLYLNRWADFYDSSCGNLS